MIPLPVILFLKNYWKHIVVLLAILGVIFMIWKAITDYGDRRYQEGVVATDTKWQQTWNEGVKKHNDRVDTLQEASAVALSDQNKRALEREANLNGIIEKLKRDAKGNVIPPSRNNWVPTTATVCVDPSKGGPDLSTAKPLYDKDNGLLSIPLGDSFTDTWNRLSAVPEKQSSVEQIPTGYFTVNADSIPVLALN